MNSSNTNETADSFFESISDNVLYTQERIGKDGVPFIIYKIRTMVHGACNDTPESMKRNEDKDPQDPRVMPTRRWMRKSCFDELPQIINILKGEMTVYGPRPITPQEFSALTEKQQAARMKVKPGLTSGYGFHNRGKRERTIRRCEDIYLYLRERLEREGKSTVPFHLWYTLHVIRAILQGANS